MADPNKILPGSFWTCIGNLELDRRVTTLLTAMNIEGCIFNACSCTPSPAFCGIYVAARWRALLSVKVIAAALQRLGVLLCNAVYALCRPQPSCCWRYVSLVRGESHYGETRFQILMLTHKMVLKCDLVICVVLGVRLQDSDVDWVSLDCRARSVLSLNYLDNSKLGTTLERNKKEVWGPDGNLRLWWTPAI